MADPAPPFLFLDAYSLDFGRVPPWGALLQAERSLRGVVLKATDGFCGDPPPWFVANYRLLAGMLGDQRGVTRLLGAYHYVQLSQPAESQADGYVRALEAVGYSGADVMPILDVEAGGERSGNRRASAQQVVDCVSAAAERVKARTGRRVMLYGRGLMRDLAIRDRMGCDCVWNPAYTRLMATNGLVTVDGQPGPWSVDDVVLWQYEGDGVADTSFTHLTTVVSSYAKVDLSVYVDGDRAPTWQSALQRLR